MRVKASGDPILEDFDCWTVSIGNGTAETVGKEEDSKIQLKEDLCFGIDQKRQDTDMKKFCQEIFPNLPDNYKVDTYMEGRAILAPTNRKVDTINDYLTDVLPGEKVSLLSADSLKEQEDPFRFNTELLNTLQPNGMPRHRIELKEGMPLRLLRNLNPKKGLCNGTRLIFNRVLNNKVLECSLIGDLHRRTVLIPRITTMPADSEGFGFDWTRRQFPVRTAFSMTVNASQGQTMKKIGVWLADSECFAHGQLYVAASRVGAPSGLKFAVKKPVMAGEGFGVTTNVVYREVLLQHGNTEVHCPSILSQLHIPVPSTTSIDQDPGPECSTGPVVPPAVYVIPDGEAGPSDTNYTGPYDGVQLEVDESTIDVDQPGRQQRVKQGNTIGKSVPRPRRATGDELPLPDIEDYVPITAGFTEPQCQYERIREANIKEKEAGLLEYMKRWNAEHGFESADSD